MRLKLPYGEGFLEAELPDNTMILKSVDAPVIENVVEEISYRLNPYRRSINRSREFCS